MSASATLRRSRPLQPDVAAIDAVRLYSTVQ